MKTLFLLFSRIRQYFLKNKALFIYFMIGGLINGIMLTYSYGNLLGTVSARESQDYRYRQYIISFPKTDDYAVIKGEVEPGFAPEQLEALLSNPLVDYARFMYPSSMTPEPDNKQILAVTIPYVDNLPIYDAFDASVPKGDYFAGTNVLNSPNEVIISGSFDYDHEIEGMQVYIEGRCFDVVGTCMGFVYPTSIIQLETFYEMELNKGTVLAYVYAKERQDFENGNDAMITLLQKTFPACEILDSPATYHTLNIKGSLEKAPLIIACYLICTISFAFLLRYLVDSTMKESIISIIVGAPKSAIAVTIFWEATVMSLVSNGLGFLLHAALYDPVFKHLNIDQSLNYYLGDYMLLLMVVFAISLVVTVPFVMKYMKLSPIAARRAKH